MNYIPLIFATVVMLAVFAFVAEASSFYSEHLMC
jgi:hypothetical protein